MKNNKIWRLVKKYCLITIGSIFFAIAVSRFFDPNDIVTGGATGIAIMVSRFVPVEVGTLILLFNIPLLIIATFKFGWRFLLSTFYATATVSLFTNIFSKYGALTEEPILVAIGGGALAAIGISLVFKAGATTGGTDIVVRLIKIKKKHLKTGTLFFYVDMTIVILSAVVFNNIEVAMYAAISLVVSSILTDVILYGTDEAKLIYVVTNKPKEIANAFIVELNVGLTILEGRGAYSNNSKEILMCVMKKQQYPKAEELVKNIDPESFLIVTKASEIFGEGYKSIFADKY